MRPRISIRGSVRPSVGPLVHPSVSRFFQIAKIDRSEKSDESNPCKSDKSDRILPKNSTKPPEQVCSNKDVSDLSDLSDLQVCQICHICQICQFPRLKKNARQTDGPTDRQMDRWTDGDARMLLKDRRLCSYTYEYDARSSLDGEQEIVGISS